MDDIPITITLSRAEWADCRAAFDDIPPAHDGPGVQRLFEAWDAAGVPDGR